MASFVSRSASSRFPAGTTVHAYRRDGWHPTVAPSGAPAGSSQANAAVASDGSLTLTGLTERVQYILYASLSGVHTYGASFFAGADRKASVEALRAFDKDNGQAGLIAPTAPGWSRSATTVTADICRSSRFRSSRDMVIASIGFGVTGAATNNDAVQAGIYDRTGTTLLASGAAGVAGVTSTGPKTAPAFTSLFTVLANVDYYAVLAYDYVSGTGASLETANFGVFPGAQMWGATAGLTEVDGQTAATLPASLTFAGTATVGFVLTLHEA